MNFFVKGFQRLPESPQLMVKSNSLSIHSVNLVLLDTSPNYAEINNLGIKDSFVSRRNRSEVGNVNSTLDLYNYFYCIYATRLITSLNWIGCHVPSPSSPTNIKLYTISMIISPTKYMSSVQFDHLYLRMCVCLYQIYFRFSIII